MSRRTLSARYGCCPKRIAAKCVSALLKALSLTDIMTIRKLGKECGALGIVGIRNLLEKANENEVTDEEFEECAQILKNVDERDDDTVYVTLQKIFAVNSTHNLLLWFLGENHRWSNWWKLGGFRIEWIPPEYRWRPIMDNLTGIYVLLFWVPFKIILYNK